MSAISVGRVGGLAVALGVGAAALQAAGVAWADTGSPDQSTASSTSSSAGRHTAAVTSAAPTGGRGSKPAGSVGAAAGKSSAARTAANPAATKVEPVIATQSAPVRSTTADSAPNAATQAAAAPQPAAVSAADNSAPVSPAPAADGASSPAAVVSATAVAPEAPAAAPVSAFLTNASAALADSSTGGNPTAPIDSPVEWSALAVARRGSVRAAASVAPPAAAVTATATYNIGACTQASASCTYIMGPSGVPIPSDTYAQTVMKYYVLPNSIQSDTTAQLVYTPEGAYPVTGIKVLPLTISAQQGQTILQNTIGTLQPGPAVGNVPVTIFGYSQSAVISSLLQRDLTTQSGLLPGLNRQTLTNVTVGQEMNPDGGWFARFPGLNAASLGEYFYGSTPENAFPTTNYTLEYDGFADSPRYPLNFLSDLNAAMGILLVHINYASPKYFANTYGTIDPTMATEGPGLACQQGATSCTKLPTTAADQNYYFIQTPNLPLLAPLRAIPLIGQPLAALVQPVLKVIVNLGYGDPAHGFTSATQPDANVPVPFGLFPQVSYKEVFQQLVAGVKQGVHDFLGSFKQGGVFTQEVASIAQSITAHPQAAAVALPTLNQLITKVQDVITNIGTRISAGASALYASLLATADFINAGLVTLPTYDATLFLDGIKQAVSGQFIQGIVNSIGRPIAADVGMISTISVLQIAVWLEAVYAAATGCGPAAPTTGLCSSS